MEYSTIKKNEIMSFSGKWVELERIVLSEISQTQKDKHLMFSLYVESRSKNNVKVELLFLGRGTSGMV
jgi:hypothetical protein